MLRQSTSDVAVIGGGLAGLSLAIQCADKGNSVVLFEKEEYPFHKVCGEYISFESFPFLESLGLPLQQWDLPVIKNLTLSDVAGRLYNFGLTLGGFGISRYKLDEALFKIALNKKVQVLTHTKVNDVKFSEDIFSIETTNGVYHSKIAAGTFGKRSNLDIKLNRDFIHKKEVRLKNYLGVKYHIEYPLVAGTIALHNFRDGYCGISAVEDNKCCLCYLTTAANLKRSGGSIAQMENDVLWQNPCLKEIFTTANFLSEQPLTISQISFGQKSQVEDHILMLGDAAGMITPLCGNGMSMALHSSKLAFECIQSFLEQKYTRTQLEEEYSILWHKEFSTRLWVGRRVQQLFGGNLSTSLFLKAMDSLPILAKNIITLTHGKPF